VNYLIASFISVLAPVFWIGTILGLPGNWGLVAIAGTLAYFAPTAVHYHVDFTSVFGMLILAIVGEVVEFVAGAAGASQLGGSKRGTMLAIAGSVVGSIAGMFVGIPVPVVGSLLAALLFGGTGAFAGAVVGERWAGKDWRVSLQIGWGALWGKLLGTVLKTVCGTVMMVLLIVAVWI